MEDIIVKLLKDLTKEQMAVYASSYEASFGDDSSMFYINIEIPKEDVKEVIIKYMDKDPQKYFEDMGDDYEGLTLRITFWNESSLAFGDQRGVNYDIIDGKNTYPADRHWYTGYDVLDGVDTYPANSPQYDNIPKEITKNVEKLFSEYLHNEGKEIKNADICEEEDLDRV